MNNSIFITTSFEGFHKWDHAPATVAFLKDKHRHIFHVKVNIEVEHNDRDIEFILFKRYVDELIKEKINLQDAGSCEMICDELHKQINIDYPKRGMIIEVSEDGENGARKNYRNYV